MQLGLCFYSQHVCYEASSLLFQGIMCFMNQLAQPNSSSSCARVLFFFFLAPRTIKLKRKLLFEEF